MADLPDGASGILRRDYKGRRADKLVVRIDPGVVSLVAEPRGHGRQAGRGIGAVVVEEPEPLDASPTARALELESRVLESAACSTFRQRRPCPPRLSRQ